MLLTRIVTAVVLLAILAASLRAASPLYFQAILLVFGAVGAWEWYRLSGIDHARGFIASILTAAAAVLLYRLAGLQGELIMLAAAAIIWFAVVLPTLWGGVLPPRKVDSQTAIFGAILLISAFLAANRAFISYGPVFLVSLLAVVFIADIAAYVVGKSIGKRKLAPTISPGKSWEGAIGGGVAVVIYGILCIVIDHPLTAKSFPSVLADTWGLPLALALLAALAAFSVVGDLFESMLKRRAGVKDSGKVLPGHGGVLDRIDAQLPVLPLAMLLTWGAA
jgi:phosphatidate cytidylyltransferase